MFQTRRKQSPSKDKKAWSTQEDQALLSFVSQFGTSSWSRVADAIKTRSGKQCRERYHNHLDPNVKKGQWTKEEDALILRLQKQYGNAWAKITSFLPGRTDNAVKNRYWSATRSAARKAKNQSNREHAGEVVRELDKASCVEKENKPAAISAGSKKSGGKSRAGKKRTALSTLSAPSTYPAVIYEQAPQSKRARAMLPLPPASVIALAEKMKREDDMKRSGMVLAPSIAAVDYLSDEEISESFLSGFSGASVVSNLEEEEDDDEEISLGEEDTRSRVSSISSVGSELLDMTDFFFFKEEPLTSFYDENILIPALY